MAARVEPVRPHLPRTFPYQIACTSCGTRLVAVDREWVVLIGPRPIDIAGSLDGTALLRCHVCSTLVPLDEDLFALR